MDGRAGLTSHGWRGAARTARPEDNRQAHAQCSWKRATWGVPFEAVDQCRAATAFPVTFENDDTPC
jgi:hypothetical protein